MYSLDSFNLFDPVETLISPFYLQLYVSCSLNVNFLHVTTCRKEGGGGEEETTRSRIHDLDSHGLDLMHLRHFSGPNVSTRRDKVDGERCAKHAENIRKHTQS